MQRNQSFGLTLIVIAAVLFSVNGGVSRAVMWHGVDPSTLTTVRLTGTFAALLVFALLFDRSALAIPRGRTAVMFVVLGLIGLASLQWLYFVAIDRIPLGLALLLEYTAPVLVALFARFVQHLRVKRRMWLGIALSLVGLAVATEIWSGLAFDGVGVGAALAAAFCFATYFIIGEEGVATIPPLRVAIWGFGIGAVALNCFAPITDVFGALDESSSLFGRLGGAHVPLWLMLLWVVVLGTLAPFCCELIALRHVPAVTATMFSMTEPIGAFLVGWAWYAENLGPVTLIGCATVVAGIVLAQTAHSTRMHEPLVT